MKIGILTFHRAINYGAVLQAYALQETLHGLGHEVSVIDYRQPRVERTDRKPFDSKAKNILLKRMHIRSWLNYNRNKELVKMRRQRFDEFLNKCINLTRPCTQEDIPQMDVYVIGSDQVWNSAICDGLDPVFWGNFNCHSKARIISYAASTSVKDLQKQDSNIIQNLLQNFYAVSVREKQTRDYINHHFSLPNDVQLVLDPTLLAEKGIWDSLEDEKFKNQNYILYFGARGCVEYPKVLQEKATSLAKQLGCGLKTIDFNGDSPVDFVNKFRNAKAVVSSSFHGVAFSLIFNRPLYAVMYGDEQDSRYVDVLKTVGAGDMLVDLHQDISPREYDYAAINQKLFELKTTSTEYLKCL